jgi:hypothetical protein
VKKKTSYSMGRVVEWSNLSIGIDCTVFVCMYIFVKVLSREYNGSDPIEVQFAHTSSSSSSITRTEHQQLEMPEERDHGREEEPLKGQKRD